ncbi:DNA ligase 1 [Thelohanellus kitauei]|uniref:DNA ligase 1 n=1 Tax=Thelohanellus kitauei TaxID=669202 RepID=A0A0C2MRL5_THEKT|nr:DNA ligase 1 [Thelohanellus kitauei]
MDEPKKSYKFPESLTPHHWFDCTTVWQVRAADISLSPIHRAAFGKLEPDKGISLRFPRFERARDDKRPEQATDIYQVMEMYRAQQKNAPDSQIPSEASDEG